jgi:hypothetical protein
MRTTIAPPMAARGARFLINWSKGISLTPSQWTGK